MELTVSNVVQLFAEMRPAAIDTSDSLIIINGAGITLKADKRHLEARRADIESLLRQLPPSFHQQQGGGDSLLNACMRADGVQWTDYQAHADLLFCLGLGIGRVQLGLPRELWAALPGEFPIILVNPLDEPVPTDAPAWSMALTKEGQSMAAASAEREQFTERSLRVRDYLDLSGLESDQKKTLKSTGLTDLVDPT